MKSVVNATTTIGAFGHLHRRGKFTDIVKHVGRLVRVYIVNVERPLLVNFPIKNGFLSYERTKSARNVKGFGLRYRRDPIEDTSSYGPWTI